MAFISSSNRDNLGDNFWFPSKNSAEYLGMNYISNLHIVAENIETNS